MIKLLVLLGFFTLIGISLTSSEVTKSNISFSIPNVASINIGGVARGFEMLYQLPGTGPAGRE